MHFLVAVMPQLKGLVRSIDKEVLDLSDYLTHSMQLEHLVVRPDDIVTRLDTSSLSALVTLEVALHFVAAFVPRCESLRRLGILWAALSARQIPRVFQVIAKSSITTLAIYTQNHRWTAQRSHLAIIEQGGCDATRTYNQR